LTLPIAPPARGSSVRARLGRYEFVLEGVRGGHSLLWSDGQQARRYALGLGAFTSLQLDLQPPRHPCRIVVRESLVLGPGGRLRGYVQVPLLPVLFGVTATGQRAPLLELGNQELAGEWDDARGMLFRIGTPWHVRFPMPSGEPRAVLPLWLKNVAAEVAQPADFVVSIAPDELVEARGSLLLRPRRLRWLAGQWQEAR
jgi:hypothetical protein